MDVLNKNVATNLRRIRKAKNMSLDAVAVQTGISKSMLGQIERGQSNPTVAILGKLVSGLRIKFQDLLGMPPLDTYLVEGDSIMPVKEVKDQYKVFVYFPYEEDRPFEIYKIQIYPGCKYATQSHGEHTAEYILVAEGQLTVQVGETLHILKKGSAIRLDTDREHAYLNQGEEMLCFDMVFAW
jgi:transcriptional regulator with XRE-family HTH domain